MKDGVGGFLGLPDAAVGPITAAIVAGVIALIGLIISKEQKTSEFRQAWIDALREEVSSLLSATNALRDIDRMAIKNRKKHWDMAAEHFASGNEALFKIKLRLNPEESDSMEILETIKAIEANFCYGTDPDPAKMAGLEFKLITQMQRYLKKEWVRVKEGERPFIIAKWSVIVFTLFALVGLLRRINGA